MVDVKTKIRSFSSTVKRVIKEIVNMYKVSFHCNNIILIATKIIIFLFYYFFFNIVSSFNAYVTQHYFDNIIKND